MIKIASGELKEGIVNKYLIIYGKVLQIHLHKQRKKDCAQYN